MKEIYLPYNSCILTDMYSISFSHINGWIFFNLFQSFFTVLFIYLVIFNACAEICATAIPSDALQHGNK